MIKTFPGTGVNYTPNTGSWISCIDGLNKVFFYISISENFGSQADWDCINATIFKFGAVDVSATTGVNNGVLVWNFANGNKLEYSTYTSDLGGCTASLSLQWQGSENGVCAGGANGVASGGGTGSWDLWRAVFTVTDSGDSGHIGAAESHLIRIQTDIPNAPVISVPYSIVFT